MTRAFLIGAGATKSQYNRAPLNNDFFTLIRFEKKLYSALSNTIQPYLKEDLKKTNVEDVMIKSYEFPSSVRNSFLENLHLAIYNLLAEPTDSDLNHYDRQKPATLFKTLLNDERLDKSDFFMTLNYDLYLDREVYSVLKKIDYGLKPSLIHWIDSSLTLSSEPDFSVYHLHGSLNWGDYNDKVSLHMRAIEPQYSRSGSNLCLVPPGKKELNPILKYIWSNAEKRLLEADELIIIGCSLNPDDTELINLVKKFVNERGPDNIKIIYKDENLKSWGGNNWPISIENNPQYEYYTKVIEKVFRAYPYGFNLLGPPNNPEYGAIEYIFK
jgi:hypothetical protein